MVPIVYCPKCETQHNLDNEVLIAQSNQNVIYRCHACGFEVKNIQTSKG
ncbi:hypothetical protein KUV80_06555 [Fictibacillus nanhaiensis]|nr:hypothetical protein [Fictibacillus nanhaiensis]MBY6036304.1 hypothetical protein [Fictibacillus nanhaiensis]